MAQVFTLEPAPARPAVRPVVPVGVRPETTELPSEWLALDDVAVPEGIIDRVLIGPNGVFTVHFDPDLRPAAIRPQGVIRNGLRVKEPVKTALRNTFALRELLATDHPLVHPYPVLVTESPGEGARLGRLLVVRPGRLAEAIWTHVSRALTRSERADIAALLRHS